MKKNIILLFLMLNAYCLYAGNTTTDLQKALTEIGTKAAFNAELNSLQYYKQLLGEIHSTCVDAHPGCCKADKITPFGVTLFVGTGFGLGAFTAYAILKTLEKTHP